MLYHSITENLQQFADDEKLHAEWAAAKLSCKKRLAKHVLDVTGVTIDPTSLFDIQIKRIHEYKRQLLNILGAVYRYKKLKVGFFELPASFLEVVLVPFWFYHIELNSLDAYVSIYPVLVLNRPMNLVGNECRREAEGYTTHCHARRESVCNIH